MKSRIKIKSKIRKKSRSKRKRRIRTGGRDVAAVPPCRPLGCGVQLTTN